MATGTIINPMDLLNTAENIRFDLKTQAGWTIGQAIVFRNAKPTVNSGSIIGERALSTAEISAFNSQMTWNANSHMIFYYTTNSAIANLSGKAILLNIA